MTNQHPTYWNIFTLHIFNKLSRSPSANPHTVESSQTTSATYETAPHLETLSQTPQPQPHLTSAAHNSPTPAPTPSTRSGAGPPAYLPVVTEDISQLTCRTRCIFRPTSCVRVYLPTRVRSLTHTHIYAHKAENVSFPHHIKTLTLAPARIHSHKRARIQYSLFNDFPRFPRGWVHVCLALPSPSPASSSSHRTAYTHTHTRAQTHTRNIRSRAHCRYTRLMYVHTRWGWSADVPVSFTF